MGDYVYEGERIKLNARDFDKMRKLYPRLDLVDELNQLDFELRDKRSWWVELNAKLRYRNSVARDRRTNTQRRDDLAESVHGPDALNF